MTGERGTNANSAARWEQIRTLFEHAVELAPEARESWLRSEVVDDAALVDTVRRMLAADAEPRDLLDQGIATAAQLVLEPEVVLAPGTRVGAFDVVGELGRGGMGTVYAAKDRHLDRAVALKFLQLRPGSERSEADRLIAEARAASALDHPNVATIYQVGESDDGRYFIAMPRFEGETLRARLEHGALPVDQAVRIAAEVAAGLAAAHRAGITHRDVTPANIFLTSDGPVKLLDFGIAALAGDRTDDGSAGGTIPYMSPEQARGAPTDNRTDVWSLGVVLFRMLTGELPFPGDSPADVLSAIRSDVPAPTLSRRHGIPRRLARVVDRALEKPSARRYADAGEMLRALETARNPRARPWLVGAAVATVAGLGVLVPIAWNRSATDATAPYRAARTLAVLPPRGAGDDTTDRYLADGVAGELTTRLAKLRRLRVKGPRAAAAAAGGAASPQALGAALGVDYLVESSVLRRDTLVLVSLRLVDAREGFQLWNDDYAIGGGNLLALQDSIARDVAGAVAGELSAAERAALGARVTRSPGAYDQYLRGNYLLAKRTPAAVGEAMAAFGAAVELDPRFAEAHAQAGYARIVYADWGWPPHAGRSGPELVSEARGHVARAIELDPGLAVAWLARAYLLVVSDPRRFEGALAAFERSLAIDSLNAEAYHQYGQTLMSLGRYPDAVAAYRRAVTLEPARPMTLVPLAAIARQQGELEDAMRWADSAVAVTRLVPAPYALAVRAHITLAAGDVDGALRDARRALDLDASYPAPALSVLAAAHARRGDSLAAAAALERLLGTIDMQRPTPTDVRFAAGALYAAGRRDDALRLIERAEPRGAQLWFYLQSRDFDPQRAHPRFQAVERAADPRSAAERSVSVAPP